MHVCRFLCLQNKLTAEVCFNQYTSQHPQVERGPPFVRPLLNFLWMLLLAVDGYEAANVRVVEIRYWDILPSKNCRRRRRQTDGRDKWNGKIMVKTTGKTNGWQSRVGTFMAKVV